MYIVLKRMTRCVMTVFKSMKSVKSVAVDVCPVLLYSKAYTE